MRHEQYQLSKRYFKKAADNTKNYKCMGHITILALAIQGLKDVRFLQIITLGLLKS